MFNQKLCLSLGNFGISDKEQIKLFKKTGFEAFTGCWHVGQEEGILNAAKIGKEEGITFEAVHAPWDFTDDMWNENEKELAEKGVNNLIKYLELTAKADVDLMVSHVYVGFDEVGESTEFGLQNYGKVIDRAKELGIRIAFENTEGENCLNGLLTHFKNEKHIGFCWDSGHEMCYNFSKDLLALYGDRLFITHLNDNLGVKDFNGKIFWHDDLHLLPFDGIGDWEYNAKRIAKTGFLGALTFELNKTSKPNRHENDKYMKMPVEEYVAECYVRACRFAKMVEKYK